MTLLLILFFISLLGIAGMIGRKLLALRSGRLGIPHEFQVEVPDIEDVKHMAVYGAKKFGYFALVETIRFSILSSRFLKEKGKEIKEKAQTLANKYTNRDGEPKAKEVSKFLSMMTDYKHKIKKIKNRIKEEEGIE